MAPALEHGNSLSIGSRIDIAKNSNGVWLKNVRKSSAQTEHIARSP